MSDPSAITKLVPGFDFLQSLAKNAGSALPSIGQWVAPTLDPKEVDRRIEELRTVQFWLEQNARVMATTIQALEVQRMTLSTLETMNVPLKPLREALSSASTSAKTAAQTSPFALDATQWWNALTQQFTQLAASTVREAATQTLKQSSKRAAKAIVGSVAKAVAPSSSVSASSSSSTTKPSPKRVPAAKRASPRKR